jgi:hypothetical protein
LWPRKLGLQEQEILAAETRRFGRGSTEYRVPGLPPEVAVVLANGGTVDLTCMAVEGLGVDRVVFAKETAGFQNNIDVAEYAGGTLNRAYA